MLGREKKSVTFVQQGIGWLKSVTDFICRHHTKTVVFMMIMGFIVHIGLMAGVAFSAYSLLVPYFFVSVELCLYIFDRKYREALNTA